MVLVKSESTPLFRIVSRKQAGFFGAEYARGKKGRSKETGMSQTELKRHLLEWGRKHKKRKK